ncbi:HNH endonuclease [Flavobacterium sp. HJSW_4]|uniref:HNH endonuclease n=1 Tax=Flavobacterium sp. HJSW_4 TaxID=3344660 RepID=UPI0035F3154A
MKKCIICFKEKEINEFNEEHIFPEAIGGNLKIYDCCKLCNSKMGAIIDSELTNNEYIKIVRFLLKIKGKNGIINPFNSLSNSAFEGIKGKLIFEKSGKYSKFEIIQKTTIETEKSLQIVCDSDNMEGMLKTINKKIAKSNQPPFTIEDLRKNTTSIPHPKLNYINIIINQENDDKALIYLIPELLKITYELGYYHFKEKYLNDPTSIAIRNAIEEIISGKLIIDRPTSIEIDGFNWKDIKRYNSYQFLIKNNKIMCHLNILNFITARIVLSENSNNYESINENINESVF